MKNEWTDENKREGKERKIFDIGNILQHEHKRRLPCSLDLIGNRPVSHGNSWAAVYNTRSPFADPQAVFFFKSGYQVPLRSPDHIAAPFCTDVLYKQVLLPLFS